MKVYAIGYRVGDYLQVSSIDNPINDDVWLVIENNGRFLAVKDGVASEVFSDVIWSGCFDNQPKEFAILNENIILSDDETIIVKNLVDKWCKDNL